MKLDLDRAIYVLSLLVIACFIGWFAHNATGWTQSIGIGVGVSVWLQVYRRMYGIKE